MPVTPHLKMDDRNSFVTIIFMNYFLIKPYHLFETSYIKLSVTEKVIRHAARKGMFYSLFEIRMSMTNITLRQYFNVEECRVSTRTTSRRTYDKERFCNNVTTDSMKLKLSKNADNVTTIPVASVDGNPWKPL